MEEKIIVKSEKANIKLIRNIIYISGFFLGFILYLWRTADWKSYVEYHHYWHSEVRKMNVLEFMFSDYANNATKWVFIVTIIVFIVIGTLFYYGVKKTNITVSNIRVYGKTTFGKRVDLPIDSVSSIGTSFMKGIAIGTSSGKIKFKLIKNQKEMLSIIGNLLKERQEKKQNEVTVINQEVSFTDEIKNLKELLDMGAITQEEFDAKKKELLGL